MFSHLLLKNESLLIFQLTAVGLISQMEQSVDNKNELQYIILSVNVESRWKVARLKEHYYLTVLCTIKTI